MTFECMNNTLRKKRKPLYDSYGKEMFIVMQNSGPVELNPQQSDFFVKNLKYLGHKRKARGVWKKLQSEGFKIILDPTQYKSEYDGREDKKTITIGVKNHSSDISYFKSANLNEKLDESYLISTLFIHECSHHIFRECFNYPETEELKKIIYSHLRTSNEALAKNTVSYDGNGIKIKEDITELIRMYISSPKFLKKHLHFLRKTGDPAILAQYDLHRINKKEEKEIYNLVKKIVSKYL